MKKIKLTLVLCVIFHFLSYSQDDGIFDRINGVPIKNSIYLYLDKDRNFYYSIDDEQRPHSLDDGSYFNIKNIHRNDFQIYIQFYNPLRNNLTSSQKDIADPAYQALSDFISKLPSGVTKTAEDVASDKSSIDVSGTTDIEISVLLNEWIFKFVNLIDPNYIKGKKLEDNYNSVVKILNGIAKTEKFLFGSFTTPETNAGDERNLSDWVKFSGTNLYNAEDNYENFLKILNESSLLQDALKNYQSTGKKNFDAVVQLLTNDFDKQIGPLIAFEEDTAGKITNNVNGRKSFKDYSIAFAKTIATNTQTQFSVQEATITRHNELIKKLTTFCDDFKGENIGGKIYSKGYKKAYSYKLDWKTKTMKSFTFDTKGLNEDGSDIMKSDKTTSIIVAKKLGVYSFVSTGILYTNFSYPQYAVSTDNNVNTVAKTGDVKVNVRPAIFLNMLITTWDPVYPFAQIGISTGVSDALFPVGIGVSFGSSFSISGGVIFGYYKDLNQLEVGKPVKDDAALQSDLTNQALFKPYFSINYNLSKK